MKKINQQIVGISGNVTATKLGKIFGQVKQVDGTETTIEMYPVKFCPKATKNLFLLPLLTGSNLQSNDANNIHLAQANGTMLTFDSQHLGSRSRNNSYQV